MTALASPATAPPPVSVLLDAPQRFENLCAIARTLDGLGVDACTVHDPFGLVRERYGRARRRTMRNVSSGAFERIAWTRVDDPVAAAQAHPGRTLAFGIGPGAVPLAAVAFEPGDCLAFGSESRGLSPALAAAADLTVTIPMRGQTQSLNLSVAVAIALHEALRQIG